MPEKIQKKTRRYFPADFEVTQWPALQAALDEILARDITDTAALEDYLLQTSELGEIIEEEMAWRYIGMTCHASEEQYSQAFNDFYRDIISPYKDYSHKLRKKYYDSPLRHQLSPERYAQLDRLVSNDIELFRSENIPLQNQEQELSNKYGALMSEMTVTYRGEEKTLPQLSIFLKDPDRSVREEVWRLIQDRLARDAEQLNSLFDELKDLRRREAKNAGYTNYRDYKHQEMGRFAYSPQDLEIFHTSVEKVVVPFIRELNQDRKATLGVDSLRPWDLNVDTDGRLLKPFGTGDELYQGCRDILGRVHPDFGRRLELMHHSGFLDLDNRKGKAPGGYNYPLQEHGASFIFMNAVGLHRDVITLLHEAGHALHSAAMAPEPLGTYKSPPMEVAELASMSMELLSMPYWDVFYSDDADLRKARVEQLEDTIKLLPWIMIVDAFQHWIYTHPEHTVEERNTCFVSLLDRYDTGVDYSGIEHTRANSWLRQLHIFEVPFYYIEYAMAQLGALAVYKNYREQGPRALEQYQAFMNLGYSLPIPDIYRAAGIRFDFSEEYIRELLEFVKTELELVKGA